MMKRRIKGLFTLFLTVAAITLTAFALTSAASAATKLSYSTSYAKDGSVNITATPSAKRNYITYTTDGTKPTYKSELIPEVLNIDEGAIVRLAEFNIDNKYLRGVKLTIKPRVAPIEVALKKSGDKAEVSLSTETLGAKIYYTLDGTAPTTDAKRFTGAFKVSDGTRIRAIAVKNGYKDSLKLNKYVYLDEIGAERINQQEPDKDDKDDENEKDTDEDEKDEEEEEDEKEETVKKPVTSVPKDKDEQTLKAVSYSIARMSDTGYAYVTLTPRKNGYKLYYTTDGSKPTTKSKQYKNARIKYTEPGVLRVLEYNSDGEKVGALNIKVKPRCAEVEMTSTAITARTNTIAMSCSTPGAKIYYTIDRTIPTEENGIPYTGPIVFNYGIQIRAVAFADGYNSGKMVDLYTDEIEYDYVNEYPDDPIYKQMADMINDYRRSKGLPALKFDEKLTEAANIRAFELSIRDGGSYKSSIKKVGISTGRTAEFRSIYTKNLESTIKEMIKSDDSGYLSENCFDIIGAGHYEGKNGNQYWVILLADT